MASRSIGSSKALCTRGAVWLWVTLLLAVPSLAAGQVRRPTGRVVPLPALPAGFHQISGTAPALPFDDLAPLAGLIGDAEIVALGESVHCSGGFYEAKDRLLRYLVSELGFRAFAIESPWQSAERAGDYVLYGSGTAEQAVGSLFSVWQSEAVLTMVEWMRARNLTHPDDPVYFFGFDIQQPLSDGYELITFLREMYPDQTALIDDIRVCDGSAVRSLAHVSTSDNDRCLAALDQVADLFENDHDQIAAASSEEALAWAWIRLIGLRAWQGEAFGVTNGNIQAAYSSRDQGMADVFLRLRELRYPGVKTVIWAHSWHIAQATHLMDNDSEFGTAVSMGTHLATALGSSYAPIDLAAYTTRFYWPWLSPERVEFRATAGIELRLHGFQRAALLVNSAAPDLCPPGVPCLRTWPDFALSTNDWAYWSFRYVPSEQFRAVLFLDESREMIPLREYR